ncbi:MAG TPA: tannase/feruloyl esterase family alpha/beta hydrolase, partial [Vicinamibacterales bacterium]|nr:tannase/feruloyl esterase family alpha/beta hydrolase [Vicinamibacterales bacterium]
MPIIRTAHVALAIVLAGSVAIIDAQGPAGPPPVRPKPLVAKTTPARACESLKDVALDNTTIESAVVDPGDAQTPASCRVTAVVTHPPAGDKVRIFLAFPMTEWNGRFQGVGGGGFSGGSAAGVRAPLLAGYAAGSTDTGHEGASGSFALDSAGRLQWMLIRDNAYLGIHEMTQTGKALTQSFYGAAPARSYFNGCSTGGRQGLSEAQRYPADYDGILSGAPAINWTTLHIEQMWGHVVMTEANHVVPACMYAAATNAAIAACDEIDGVQDGVIEDPARCTYDPKALVGTSAGACGTFTDADANVIRKIWDGPHRLDGTRIWYGLPRGADFMGVSGTGGTPLVSRPNPITLEWWRYFLFKDPKWDPTGLTRAGYEQALQQSLEEFSAVIATDNPDLSEFKARGGKIVMWHGQADPLIYPGGSIDYYQRVEKQMGGRDKTGDVLRFFLAPGVGHCGGGAGPNPSGQFEAMVNWVETGKAPETLDAVRRNQSVTRTRP